MKKEPGTMPTYNTEKRSKIIRNFENLISNENMTRAAAAREEGVSLGTINRWIRTDSYNTAPSEKNELVIFISHRHDDSKIADKFREALEDWGIPYRIFQTSHYKNAIASSNKLHEELRLNLANTILHIIIYTIQDANWSYVTYEYGISEQGNTNSTNYAIFECAPSEILPVFQDRVRYKVSPINMDGILSFTQNLHHTKNFFPGEPAFLPESSTEVIQRKAKVLYDELLKVIPSEEDSWVFRWAVLSIALEPEDVKAIKNIDGDRSHGLGIIENNAKIELTMERPLSYFGFGSIPDELTWKRFITNWKDNSTFKDKNDEIEKCQWIEDMHRELWRAIYEQSAERIGSTFASLARPGNQNYQLIITRVRRYPNCRMTFDIVFYPQGHSENVINANSSEEALNEHEELSPTS